MRPAKLGTFLGVFTPSILTILGVILYLRIGWVVGNAGILPALAIVVLSNSITLITALSVSAVATNMRVEVGGAYYIVSRSLGLQVGGAIGIPLFLSQALSVTLYSFGFAESMRILWAGVPIQIVAAGTIVMVTLLSIRGASLALKLQLPIMAAVGISLVSLAAGVSLGKEAPVYWGRYPDAPGFWFVFAVFFPAVTGILAGVSMSGDLKDPQRSIPLGVVAAVLTGFFVYLCVPLILGFSAPKDALVGDSLVWLRISIVPALVFPGLLGAIFSSAVGSILGAPRTLQALSNDRVLPVLFTRFPLKNGESVPAILLSACIALAAVLTGGLNAVAPLVTMFFLTTYGMINLVAGLETLIADPSYRPSLKVPWAVSLMGALACFCVMFLISKPACILAILIELGVWAWLKRRRITVTWGDMRRGLWWSIARYALINLKSIPRNPRNWRPHILLFAGDARRRMDLIRFASWLNQDRGILTVCNLLEGDLEKSGMMILEREESIEKILEDRGLLAFSEVNVVSDFEEGVVNVAQANGIAGLTSNTLMFGWTTHLERLASYFRIMRRVAQLRMSLILCRISPRTNYRRSKEIDIWWRGKQHNGDMMLLLAYLLSLNQEWEGATITIKSIASSEMAMEEIRQGLARLMPTVRIQALTKVILKPSERTVAEIMREESRDAEVVFLGLMQPEPGEEMEYAKRLSEMVQDLPNVVLVRNSGWFAGELV